ncbi:hypothetical protein BDF14DRAFT_1849474 [Spinellus fusiger]|nr:hypothetical protein BDF14DRAFT_1849474 [Spinellus fusiger]
MGLSLVSNTSLSPLIAAFYEQLQATLQLIQVALQLEWTIFSRLIGGVLLATMGYIVYLIITLRHSRQPLVMWEKLAKPLVKLYRPRLFALLLGNIDPYARSIDMRVSTYSRGFCTGIMRDRNKNRNSYNSIHSTALATFAETVGGLALLSLVSSKDRVVLTGLTMEYKKKARGLLTASSECVLPADKGTHSVTSKVVVKDRTLDTVAVATLAWTVETKEA